MALCSCSFWVICCTAHNAWHAYMWENPNRCTERFPEALTNFYAQICLISALVIFPSLRCLINSFDSQIALNLSFMPFRGTYCEIYTGSSWIFHSFTIVIIVCLLCRVVNIAYMMFYGIKRIFPSEKCDGTPLRLLWGYMGCFSGINLKERKRLAKISTIHWMLIMPRVSSVIKLPH